MLRITTFRYTLNFLHLNYLCTLFRNDDKVKYTI